MILGISGAVDGKNDIDMAIRLDDWMERNVFVIFPSIHERKALCLSNPRGRIAIAVKWIGLILRDIFMVIA